MSAFFLSLANLIYRSRELDCQATCAESAHVQIEGSRTVRRPQPTYDLEAIISVGYLIPFENDLREWGAVLRRNLYKNYTGSDRRKKKPFG